MHLIALDLDGTLEDSRDDMVAVARRTRASRDLPERSASLLLPWVNGGMERLYRACFDDYLAGGDPERRMLQVREAYEADYLEHVAVETRLYDGMASTLHELSGLGTLACVTNKPERISRALLAALGVERYFGAVVGGDSCAEAKPNPMMLAAAAARCGFDPTRGRCFMIGDSAADIQLGRAYGATTLWCAWGYLDEPGEVPDFRAGAPRELPGIVRRCLADPSAISHRAQP